MTEILGVTSTCLETLISPTFHICVRLVRLVFVSRGEINKSVLPSSGVMSARVRNFVF